MRRIPWLLIIFRLAAGPGILLLAMAGQTLSCAGLLILGVLSDIFDGVIARRLGVATVALRTWDSRADVLFWVSTFIAVAVARPTLIPLLWPLALTIALLEVGNHLVSLARFRREASPHHYLSKLFGLGLCVLCAQAFLSGDIQITAWAVFVIGVLSQIEALAITLRLKSWRCDVPSVLTLKA